MVLYQAKANREEYDYLQKYFPTKQALTVATGNLHDNIQKYSAYYPGTDTFQKIRIRDQELLSHKH